VAYEPHWLLAFGGSFIGTGSVVLEGWSCTMRLSHEDESLGTLAPSEAALDYYAGLIETWFSDSGTTIASSTKLEFIKLNAIGANGKYSNPWTNQQPATESTFGGGGSPKYPPQISYAVSLRTALRGPRVRGRFFLPGICAALQTANLGISTTSAGQIAATTKTMINGMNAGTGVWTGSTNKPQVSIVSKTGSVTPVSEIWCGQALDTVRDRRKDLAENYVKVPL
jgi:hypothetical protein